MASSSLMLPTAQSLPQVDPRAVDVDDLLSKELSRLSFQHRSAIYEEIHGVRTLCPEETPELVEECLHQLSVELACMGPNLKTAYDEACLMYPETSYIHTNEFKLRFLRYELMNPKKAALRIVSFLECAVELFGKALLQRPLQLSDLGKDGMDCLRCGDYQPLPFRDRAGRRIIAFVNTFCLQYPIEVRMKVIYYLHWALTEDTESQRKGLVGVLWWPTLGCSQTELSYAPGPRDHILGARLYAGNPARVAAIHICLPNKPLFALLRSVFLLAIGDARQRIKVHAGEGLAVQYSLHGYGIPVDLIPVTEAGNVKTKNHQQWIKVRRMKERNCTDSPDEAVECPCLNDVIFRIGDSYLHHPGNVMFRGLIEARYEAYTSAGRNEKIAITWSLVDEVLNRNGRFLVWDAQWWSVLHDREKMREKVAGAFKNQKRKLKSLSNTQTFESSTYEFERQDGHKRKRTDVERATCLCKC